MSSTFHTTKQIKPEHQDFPIKQIYLWFITKDSKLPIVSKKSGGYQLPGGKPEAGEDFLQTITREMFEESGIDISKYSEPKMFGYYLLENDPNWSDLPKYLQLRYYLFVDADSEDIALSNNEREEDRDKIENAIFVDLNKLPEYITWIKEEEEYQSLLDIYQTYSD